MKQANQQTMDPALCSEQVEMAEAVEAYLAAYLDERRLPKNLDEAIRYALLGGGKRLRPLLCIQCGMAVGGTLEACLPAAAAMEMVHAFSLIHDDLPALDNDDLRRGRPTLHIKHGEAMAILAGDALMSLAFQVLADRLHDPVLTGRLLQEVALGTSNMIAGQVFDTLGGFSPSQTPEERLKLIHANKTGALIRAACRAGALSGMTGRPVDEGELEAVTTYGNAIGLMFQIVDDLLDIEQTAEHIGKRTSKDVDAGKLTYPSVIGAQASRAEIERLGREAREAVARFGPPGEPLLVLVEYLSTRTR